MKEKKSPFVSVSYRQPIVSYTFHKSVELGFPEILDLISKAEKISNQTPYVVFCDMRKKTQMTREGRKTAAEKSPLRRGSAWLVSPDQLKEISPIIKELKTRKYPFRAFTDKTKAIEWLLKLPLDK